MQVNHRHLYGLEHLGLIECLGHQLESNTAAAFLKMQQAAVSDGLDIQICSAYRDFDKQQSIWNAKASGKRVLLNKESQPVAIELLSSSHLIDMILIWSAIPGMSRHHWGTDIDIFDANQISRHDLRLISQEYQADGPCFQLSQWLDSHAHQYGFYRPYQENLSGVSPEPWHFSYFPISKDYINNYHIESIKAVIADSSILHKDVILERIDALVDEYVFRVAPIPAL
ncbi:MULTISPECIES: M15 family metallopeptidase [unclassified Shewanella]|uniref:M15 family metallopeptidase n=1 Tax=unclassified Shewanella TaxID=196818 RepID=UPI001C7E1C78|nr:MULTISPECIES: M15 family metallopeptidase [unclassified Shewanella]